MNKAKKKLKFNKRKWSFAIFTTLVQLIATAIGFGMKYFFNASDHLISQIYILGVLVIALKTEGYWFGISSVILDTFIINYFFTEPLMAFNFSIETIPSMIVAFAVSFASTVLTTKVRDQEKIKAESEKEKMRANLLRAVSHDIRTPLTAIYGSTTTVIENYDDLSRSQKIQLLTDVKNDSVWLVRMMENLLSVTRVTDDAVSLNMTSISVEELVSNVVAKFTKRNEVALQGDEFHKPITFKVEMPDHCTFVEGDVILLGQVLSNILDNAIYHAKGMTTLCLSVTDNSKDIIFTVYDDGCGIKPERMSTLFTGTYNSSEKKADNGRRNIGIGLSLCATIIKAHDGTIVAKNRPGGGASFSFTLKKEEDKEDEQ